MVRSFSRKATPMDSTSPAWSGLPRLSARTASLLMRGITRSRRTGERPVPGRVHSAAPRRMAMRRAGVGFDALFDGADDDAVASDVNDHAACREIGDNLVLSAGGGSAEAE